MEDWYLIFLYGNDSNNKSIKAHGDNVPAGLCKYLIVNKLQRDEQ